MSQRDSGYERKERDLYEMPEWATLALIPHLPRQPRSIWEPGCGSGKMLAALRKMDADTCGTDIDQGKDFFDYSTASNFDAIITNPPYERATDFIWHALALTMPAFGLVAMLLRTDFDHAKTRADLFAKNSRFAKKVALTKRIKWFEDSKGQPSFNHAWFIWDHKHSGPPTLAYAP